MPRHHQRHRERPHQAGNGAHHQHQRQRHRQLAGRKRPSFQKRVEHKDENDQPPIHRNRHAVADEHRLAHDVIVEIAERADERARDKPRQNRAPCHRWNSLTRETPGGYSVPAPMGSRRRHYNTPACGRSPPADEGFASIFLLFLLTPAGERTTLQGDIPVENPAAFVEWAWTAGGRTRAHSSVASGGSNLPSASRFDVRTASGYNKGSPLVMWEGSAGGR